MQNDQAATTVRRTKRFCCYCCAKQSIRGVQKTQHAL